MNTEIVARMSTGTVSTALFLLILLGWVSPSPASDGVIYACVNKVNGNTRIVASPGSCMKNEVSVQWNVQGPQGEKGDPGDAVKADPPCFDDANRYVDCGNGTVTDTVTGRVWLKNANCFGRLYYEEANEAAAHLHDLADNTQDCGLNDHSSLGDWRLPTKAEWDEMVAPVELDCTYPPLTNRAGTTCYDELDPQFSDVQSADYWSSTSNVDHPNRAWGIVLSTASTSFDGDKDEGDAYVWPVRSGR